MNTQCKYKSRGLKKGTAVGINEGSSECELG